MTLMERLYKKIEENGFVCVGLDTSLDYIPEKMKKNKSVSEQLFNFNKEIIDNTKEFVLVRKFKLRTTNLMALKECLLTKIP